LRDIEFEKLSKTVPKIKMTITRIFLACVVLVVAWGFVEGYFFATRTKLPLEVRAPGLTKVEVKCDTNDEEVMRDWLELADPTLHPFESAAFAIQCFGLDTLKKVLAITKMDINYVSKEHHASLLSTALEFEKDDIVQFLLKQGSLPLKECR
jgi:hypothetical protein